MQPGTKNTLATTLQITNINNGLNLTYNAKAKLVFVFVCLFFF